MADDRGRPGAWALLSLGLSRSLVRTRRYFLLAVGIAVLYALISMIVGGMLALFWPPAHLVPFWVVLPSGTPAWDYPGFLAATPFFVLSLPFLPTWFMVLTSAGVGLGMTVALVLTQALLRQRRAEAGRPAAIGTAAGLTPAMIALITLGACCSTTAAATAGIGITAQATGTSTGTLLLNNWYLGLFQLVVLYIALLAQEQLLVLYGSRIIGGSVGLPEALPAPPLDRRYVAGAILRVLLLAGGVTWCLAVVASWLSVNPASASPLLWVSWIVQHELVGLVAVILALFPAPVAGALLRGATTVWGRLLRAALVVGGLSLAIGLPPPVAAAGWHGLLNELLGAAGVASTMGGIAPGLPLGLALALRWIVQYALLGSFAAVLGWSPSTALRPLLWTTPDTARRPVSSARLTPEGSVAASRVDGALVLPPDTSR